MNLEELHEKLLKATGHPLAMEVLEEALQALQNLGIIMVGQAKKDGLSIEKMDELRDKLLKNLSDEDVLDFYSPTFIIMLCGALTASVKGYLRRVNNA